MDAFLIIDGHDAVLIGVDGIDRTALFAGTLVVADGVVRAGLSTFAAFFTFIRIDIGFVTANGNGAEFTGVHAFFAKAFLAVVSDNIPLNGTLGAVAVQHLDNIVVVKPGSRIFSFCQTDPLTDDLTLAVYAAAEGGFWPRQHFIRDVIPFFFQSAFKSKLCHLAEHFLFHVVDIGCNSEHNFLETMK